MIRVWRQHSPPPSGAGIRCEGELGGRTRCACYFLFFFLKSNFAAFRSDLASVVIRLGVGHPFRPDLASVSPALVFQVGPPFDLGSDPRPLALYTAITHEDIPSRSSPSPSHQSVFSVHCWHTLTIPVNSNPKFTQCVESNASWSLDSGHVHSMRRGLDTFRQTLSG